MGNYGQSRAITGNHGQSRAITSNHGRAYLPRAHVDHGLDGEAMADLHRELSLVARIVRDVGRAVEELADAVATVGLVDRETCKRCVDEGAA
eukprot:7381523-Prymnesium_polylepis.1